MRLSRIVIFPIKALDGVQVAEASIRPGGGLSGDREPAIFDAAGRIVNGKRDARVHALRASYDLASRVLLDHFYRLCTGTCVPSSEAGKVLRIGDSISVEGA